jgi:hypothetical protein
MPQMILSRFSDIEQAKGCLERLDDCDLDVTIKPVADGTWVLRGGKEIVFSQAQIVRFSHWTPVIKTDSGEEVEALPTAEGRILIIASA